MPKYSFWLTVEEKVSSILERLTKAMEEIEKCYAELRMLNVITLGARECTSCQKDQEEEN